MPSYIDQLNNEVIINEAPQRIVSVVPSQTELLFDLGLGNRVAGVTTFCTEPATAVADKVKVGGTKRFLFDWIDEIQPDLILANKEENYQAGIDHLREKYPVWVSDILNLEDAVQMIVEVGLITGSNVAAAHITQSICSAFESSTVVRPVRAAYIIWKKPWMCAASGTFIDDMMQKAGLVNVFSGQSRYPEFALSELSLLNAEYVLLSSEPFPFCEEDANSLRAELGIPVLLVDAVPFSWYGGRLRSAPAYFQSLQARIANQ